MYEGWKSIVAKISVITTSLSFPSLSWSWGPATSHALTSLWPCTQSAEPAEKWGEVVWGLFFFKYTEQAGHRIRCGTSWHGMVLWHVRVGSIQSALKPGVLGHFIKGATPAFWMGLYCLESRNKNKANRCLVLSWPATAFGRKHNIMQTENKLSSTAICNRYMGWYLGDFWQAL